ncbi:hypothetical protein [Lutispora thermophila]|uniref:Uncharacterized protein n=1 Tax=Lutispora thermophila DSM 19022 TaxID=1122184 RepID=A0A1M6BX18_9FIRM|nr:hypothetical protein [Lutispora thermophila]SHI53286.1 hypothetical protein SAMN02745176_00580 [Lutispora thermophila DSM 19022]
MVFNFLLISDNLFLPMQKQANFIYPTADEIIAVSDTYKNRALKVNNKTKKAYSIYLGTDLSTFDMLAETNRI